MALKGLHRSLSYSDLSLNYRFTASAIFIEKSHHHAIPVDKEHELSESERKKWLCHSLLLLCSNICFLRFA